MNAYQEAQLDALGDSTRRAIIERLLKGPLPVNEIAGHFLISRPAVSQHLRVLKDARLVAARSIGTRHVYALDPRGFESLRKYFDRFWTQALNAFKNKVEEIEIQ